MKWKTFLIYTFLLFSFTYPNYNEGNAFNNNIIKSFHEDLTGDGLHESIHLKGELLTNDTHYYRNIWLSVKSPFANEWKIPLMGGYEPQVQFIDLNHDNISDVFYKSKFSDDDSTFQFDLYSFGDGTVNKLTLPNEQFIQGQYKSNFKITFQLSPYHHDNKNITIDVSQFKEDYVKRDIYDNEGNVMKKAKPFIIDSVYLEPILVSESKGNGLKSIHIIKDDQGINQLGKIETLWYFKNNAWIIIQSKWSKS